MRYKSLVRESFRCKHLPFHTRMRFALRFVRWAITDDRRDRKVKGGV